MPTRPFASFLPKKEAGCVLTIGSNYDADSVSVTSCPSPAIHEPIRAPP